MSDEEKKNSGEPSGAQSRARSKKYALRIIALYVALRRMNDEVARVLGRQLLRSGTSVGAHHREASRARSTAEFISKMEGGLQELDESGYWMELLAESATVTSARLAPLMDETDQLIRIFVTSIKTAKRRRDGK
jgi:four helix bundle protein